MTHNDDDMDMDDDFYADGNEGGAPGRGHNGGPPMDGPDGLEGLDFDEMLRKSRELLIRDLYKAVMGGYATPQEKNTLRQMLKDNGMVMGDPFAAEGASGNVERRPKADLPKFEDPDYA